MNLDEKNRLFVRAAFVPHIILKVPTLNSVTFIIPSFQQHPACFSEVGITMTGWLLSSGIIPNKT